MLPRDSGHDTIEENIQGVSKRCSLKSLENIVMRVAVFCSSRENINDQYKESAQIVGRWIGSNKCTLVYGGVDKGLMRIVASATKESGGRTVGIVPVTRMNVRNVLDDEIIYAQDLNDRKAKMLSLSDVFVVLPGGYGTLDELISIFTSLAFANNKTKQIILLNQNHIFDNTLEQFKVMIRERMMEQELLWRVKEASSPQECCKYLNELNTTK